MLSAAEAQDALPEGPGLAAKYARDVGIGDDASVLLAESFEEGALADLGGRWENVSNQDGKALAFSDDIAAGLGGERALEITATLAENTGGHLYTRLPREVDQAYARFYVKFPDDGSYIHHFVHFGGYNPSTPWPQGGAGERPVGDDRITTGIEPHGANGRHPPPGAWGLYTYWHEMKISADDRYWGNSLQPAEIQLARRGEWQCVEVMIKLNSEPDAADGEMALWLDGRLVAHIKKGAPRGQWSGMGFRLLDEGGEPFEGFRWRTSNDLKLNFFWLMLYVTDSALQRNGIQNPDPTHRVLFDNIVVATEYIGPAAGAQ